jgi:hypothetical protein
MSLLFDDDNYSLYNQNRSVRMGVVGPLALIATRGNEAYVNKVNDELYRIRRKQVEERPEVLLTAPGFLRKDYQTETKFVRFSSGEAKCSIEQTLRGHDVFIIADVLNHGVTYNMRGLTVPMSPDEHLQDIKRAILAIGNKAQRINVVMPYLYQSKQVLRLSRAALDCAQMLKELINLNVHSIITFEPHEPRIENAIPQIGLERIPCSYLLLRTLLEGESNLSVDKKDLAIISPDEAAMKRGIFYSSILGVQMSTFYRQRDYTGGKNNKNGDYPVSKYRFLGENLAGKNVLIVDDMIISGETMLKTAYRLRQEQKVKDIYCLATFPIMTKGVKDFCQAYKDGVIKGLYSTDLIYHTPELKEQIWYHEADTTKFVASLIDCINHNASISKLIDQTASINELLEKRRHKI